MRPRQSVFVEVAFRCVHDVADACRTAPDLRTAVVPEKCWRVDFVMFGQLRNDVLPDAARADYAMQQDQGRSLRCHARSVTPTSDGDQHFRRRESAQALQDLHGDVDGLPLRVYCSFGRSTQARVL